MPFFGLSETRRYLIDGHETPSPGHEPPAAINGVSPHYFETVGTRLLSGRTFDQRDVFGAPKVYVINQAMGKLVDRRSDVFSTGSVFYEFLTGEKPFKGKTLHAVLFQIIQESPDPVLTLNPELPTRLAAVVHRM